MNKLDECFLIGLERKKPVVKIREVEVNYPLGDGKCEKRKMQDVTDYFNQSEEIKVMGAEVMYL